MVQNPSISAGDIRDSGLFPGSGRSPGEGCSNSLEYSCLENPMDRGAWRATIHRVTKSQIQMKRLSTLGAKDWNMQMKVLREALTCSRDVRCLVLGTEYIYCSSSSFVLTVNNCDHNISFELKSQYISGFGKIDKISIMPPH